MNSLKDYIRQQLQKGYSYEQIINYLQQQGYNNKELLKIIDDIKQEDYIYSLQNYITKSLNQGYTQEQLKNYLISQGHSRKIINKLFRELTDQTRAEDKIIHEHTIENNTLIKVSLMVFLLIVSVFGGFLITQQLSQNNQPVKLLDLKTDSIKATINQGDPIRFKLSMINQGEPGRVDIYLTYEVETIEGNKVMKKQETKAFETTITDIILLDLPKDLPQGTYIVKVKADYLDQEAKSQFTFYVKSEQEKKINNQNKNEKIINDSKKSSIKTNKPIKSTTINQTSQTKIHDQTQFTKAISQELEINAVNICKQIKDSTLKDNCISYTALKNKDEKLCEEITNQREQEDCKMVFIQEGHFYLCKEIELTENKNLCKQYELINKIYDYGTTNDSKIILGNISIEPITDNNTETNLTIIDMGPGDFIN